MMISECPSWIDHTSRLTGDKFKKIFIFCVINIPLSEKSARAISLPDGVEIPIDYKIVPNADGMYDELLKKDLVIFPPSGDYAERAVFVRSRGTKVVNFIDHIRNSIAHGRFNVVPVGRDEILILEDRNTKGECAARIVIRTSTLANWIDGIHR